MKLTVYDKSNSHPALTYKGKRIITVCRDGSMYLSRILSRELSLHAGNRLCIARDEDRPKDWYMFVSDDTRQPDTEGSKSHRYEISPISERKSRGYPKEGKRSDLRVSLFSCAHRQNHNGFRLIRLL